MRKAKAKSPIEKKAREYLAEIGRRGGLRSRRELTRREAKQMVAIREAKRAAIRTGKLELTRERWPLKVKPRPKWSARQVPQIRRQPLFRPYTRSTLPR